MERLAGKELRRVSEFLRELYQLRTHEEFTTHLVAALRTITEGEFTSYNEYPHAGNPGAVKADHAGFCDNITYYSDVLFRHIHQHPIHTYTVTSQQCTALTLSDFLTQREFRKTDLYNEFFKPLCIPYVIGTAITIDRAHFVSIARHRDRKEFGGNTKTILNAIRPHIVQSFRNALVVTQMQDQLAAMDQAMEAGQQAVVSVTREGRIRFATPHVQRLFTWYGLHHKQGAEWIAPSLREWVQQQTAQLEVSDDIAPVARPLAITGERGILHIRAIRKEPHILLLLEETGSQATIADLAQFGLSRRETEILGLVVDGKTNPEIGMILGISSRTVKKHLEHVYTRLGVENRHAAMTLVMGMIRKA